MRQDKVVFRCSLEHKRAFDPQPFGKKHLITMGWASKRVELGEKGRPLGGAVFSHKEDVLRSKSQKGNHSFVFSLLGRYKNYRMPEVCCVLSIQEGSKGPSRIWKSETTEADAYGSKPYPAPCWE